MGILILTQPGHPANTYGRYAAEVLRGEGFSDLSVQPLDAAAGDSLAAYDAVVLTPALPRRVQVDALVELVKSGGRLIVVRPSRVLAAALGLTPVDTVTYPAYVLPGEADPVAAGVPHESIQTHVPADQYEPHALPPESHMQACYAGRAVTCRYGPCGGMQCQGNERLKPSPTATCSGRSSVWRTHLSTATCP